MLNRGQGYRTALATATRGNGGQNEIGPEIFEALGVLRTEELAALHRFDGAEQYFTRAVDFGYSFSIEETFEKWGRDEILGDYVRLIRMIRPDVIIDAAADRQRRRPASHGVGGASRARRSSWPAIRRSIPEQIKDGLRPWQPKKFYHTAGFGFPGEPPPAGRVDARQLGRVRPAARQDLRRDRQRSAQHAQVPGHGRSCSRCRADRRRRPISSSRSTIAGQMQQDETSLFDGVDTSIAGLAKFAGARPPKDLTDGLTAIANAVQIAQKTFDTVNDEATLKPLLDGLFAVRALRASCASMAHRRGRAGSRSTSACARRKASSSRPRPRQRRPIEALADDGVVVPGQPVKVTSSSPTAAPATWRSSRSSSMASTATPACTHDGVHRRRLRFPRRRARGPRRRQRAAGAADAEREEGSGRALRADADRSGDRARQRAVLASRGRSRPLHVRRRRAVRPAVPADAVLRAGDARRCRAAKK